MKREAPVFKTEADLCAAFTAALPTGWTAYPETGGFDLLLVRDADRYQLGIEAKLKLNAHVVAQAVKSLDRSYTQHIGPDYRAVLVPQGEGVAGVRELARHCGITVIDYRPPGRWYGSPIMPQLPEPTTTWADTEWFELVPQRRCELPEYVPDVAAGAPAPVQLTKWKIQALKLVVIMETRGPVTRADFKALGLDARRWTEHWLLRGPDGYRPSDAMPNFKGQHPKVYADLLATTEKWMPKYLPPAPKQEALV